MIRRTQFLACIFVATAWAQTPDGAALFRKHCATCHYAGNPTRAPLPYILALHPRQSIADSLEKGTMKALAANLSAAERNAVIDYLVKPSVAPQPPVAQNQCASPAPAF